VARDQSTAESDKSDASAWPEWAGPVASQRLREPLRQQSVGHAYLLSGPRGVGKGALATAFAQALCCVRVERDDLSEPCGNCRSCRNVLRGSHPDVEVFDLDSQAELSDKPGRGTTLSIETIRSLRATCALLPVEAARRILIVDDADTMLEPAQQALLKTLEEPPRAVTIILLADEPEALAATIRSRCHEIAVPPATEQAVHQTLRARGVDDDLAAEIAFLSRGRTAWALTAAADGKVLQARREERDSAQSWIASSTYDRLVTAFRLGEQYAKRRADVIGIVQAATQLLRNEMIAASQPGADGNENRGTALGWSRAIAASLRCLADLEANVRPRLALEAMVLSWPSRDRDQA
jgi:DNA polymerase-3 subunit delta'